MTPDEVCAYLALGEGASARERLRHLYRRGGLPVIKRGKFIRFRFEDVEAWLQAGERRRKTLDLARLRTA
jgi:excisionase family DNA binding protein